MYNADTIKLLDAMSTSGCTLAIDWTGTYHSLPVNENIHSSSGGLVSDTSDNFETIPAFPKKEVFSLMISGLNPSQGDILYPTLYTSCDYRILFTRPPCDSIRVYLN